MSRAYAMETLKDLQPYVDNAIAMLMAKMKEQSGDMVNLGEWVQFFAMGMSCFSANFL